MLAMVRTGKWYHSDASLLLTTGPERQQTWLRIRKSCCAWLRFSGGVVDAADGIGTNHLRVFDIKTKSVADVPASANMPSARSQFVSVWTGTEFLVWGGHDWSPGHATCTSLGVSNSGSLKLSDGALFKPAS